ncbi:hypothetical protein ASG22_12320 [Chryseobacterium sp. Leaf405]|nr:hypothetical protein ASG22_12320 [Chryseobacterium sp. Leaf405]
MILQQEDLKRVSEFNYFTKENPCHIYLICKRPRISIDTENFIIDKDKIIFTFKIQRQNTFENIKIEIPNTYNTIDFKLTSEYPYNYFELRKNGEILLNGKSAVFLQSFGSKFTKYLDLEVLYIGQSYGVKGARTAPERLQSHSTLQGIYSEAIIKNPDCEIWLILTSFEQILLTSMDGRMRRDDEEKQKDTEHLERVTNAVLYDGLKEQQVINFTEAALIRYFQPPYNIEYKNTFPNPAHSTYSECFELDINSICIEVDTQNISCRLFSDTIPAHWWHMHNFFLHSNTERKSMFEYDKPLK